jgi:hypothetical protein
MNMVEEHVVALGFNKENSKMHAHHTLNNFMANPIRPLHKRPKGPSWNKVLAHHILQNKGERTNFENVLGLIKKRIAPNPLEATTTNLNPNQPCYMAI